MFILAYSLVGCAPEAAQYEYGIALSDVEFTLFDTTEGIHPSVVTLQNPHNPFSQSMPSKWDIESAGYPIASFYAWAVTLAMEATGEHQFYAASSLHRIYSQELCTREESYYVRRMALEAYQTQLDSFPYAVSYSESGAPFPIDTLAYDAIVSLGGDVQNWTKISNQEGEDILVPVESP
ncbi:MAG: hypothetical protein VX278_21020 [Myxococcota bacterium]|nr:hypothetical protein [Myxococcota bacterium]